MLKLLQKLEKQLRIRNNENFSWLIKLRERVFIKDGTFKTYEEARLECLKKLIEINIKQ